MSAGIIIKRFVASLIRRLHPRVHRTRWQFVVDIVTVVRISLRFWWKFYHVIVSRIVLSGSSDTVNVLNATGVIFFMHCNFWLIAWDVLRLADTTG
jgi:hypothetical protein